MVDNEDHFFVMVGQLIDNARIGGIALIFDLSGGEVVKGVPSQGASTQSPDDNELDHTGYARRVELDGIGVDLADVRRATVVYPAAE
jgi:hypothetical protein